MKVIRYSKSLVPLLLAVMAGLAAIQADAKDFSQLQKPRVFTLTDDKTVTLKVLDWNEQRKRFYVENTEGRKSWISPNSFSEADRTYMKEWIVAKWFLSNDKLYVSAKRATKGGYVYYNVSIQNKTSVNYAKVSLEYEVQRTSNNYQSGKKEKKNVPGKIFIGSLKPKSRRDFETQPVRTGETYRSVETEDPVLVRSGVSYTYTNVVHRKTGKETVNGIRLKFLGPKLDNVQIVREVTIDK